MSGDLEKKILIIDDDQDVRGFLELFLKRKGYSNVHTVPSGQDALDLIAKTDVDLVFCDIRMPGIDGIETLRRIKQYNSGIPVIMITGFPEESVAKEAIKEGAYDYIIKPFDLEYLELSMLSKMALMGK